MIKEEEGDNYSDSFEDNNSQEDKEEGDDIQEEVKQLEQFLKTATLKDIKDLKQSLSDKEGFKEINKMA